MRSSSRLMGMLAVLSASLPGIFTKGATPPKLEMVKPAGRRTKAVTGFNTGTYTNPAKRERRALIAAVGRHQALKQIKATRRERASLVIA